MYISVVLWRDLRIVGHHKGSTVLTEGGAHAPPPSAKESGSGDSQVGECRFSDLRMAVRTYPWHLWSFETIRDMVDFSLAFQLRNGIGGWHASCERMRLVERGCSA